MHEPGTFLFLDHLLLKTGENLSKTTPMYGQFFKSQVEYFVLLTGTSLFILFLQSMSMSYLYFITNGEQQWAYFF